MHFLALLTRDLESCRTKFHQNFSVDALWEKDERFSVWGQKVNGQDYSMTKSPADTQLDVSAYYQFSFWAFKT